MNRKQYISFLLLFWLVWIPARAAETFRERVYIQTDKQTYLAGELLWLKVYVTNQAGAPSPLSKVGYVELLDEETALIQVKIEISEGEGSGCLELPVALPTAHYRLVGYTQYMCNEGEEIFFRKEIRVINTFRVDKNIPVLPEDEIPEPDSVTGSVNNIRITTGKKVYTTRSRVDVNLESLPADLQTVCISVAGTGLDTGLPGSTVQRWREELSHQPNPAFSGNYIPEYEGHIIKGRIVHTTTGAEVPEQVISLLSFTGNDIRLFSGQAGEKGEVSFYTTHIKGKTEVATVAVSYTDELYRVDLQSPFAARQPQTPSPVVLIQEWEEELLKRSAGLQILHVFIGDSLGTVKTGPSYFHGTPDWTYIFDEYTRFTTMEEVVIEFLLPLRFRKINHKRHLSVLGQERTGFSAGNSLVLLDGIPLMDHELLFRYDPYLLQRVDVYRGQYVFGEQLFNGIAAFQTFGNNYPGLVLDASTQLFDYEGTRGDRVFYSPVYDSPEKISGRLPDYRHTLFWNPALNTGGALKTGFGFYTSDMEGTFVIRVEGITKKGEAVFATQTIEVKNDEQKEYYRIIASIIPGLVRRMHYRIYPQRIETGRWFIGCRRNHFRARHPDKIEPFNRVAGQFYRSRIHCRCDCLGGVQ